MSRAPPFPTTAGARTRSPAPATNGNGGAIRPLQISRPARPASPSASGRAPPARPARRADPGDGRAPRARAETADSSVLSPAMDVVMSAFAGAGARKRTLDSADPERAREKAQAAQEVADTTRRIREKVPGRRRVRAGDIDGVWPGARARTPAGADGRGSGARPDQRQVGVREGGRCACAAGLQRAWR
jgi:hypothetical protein